MRQYELILVVQPDLEDEPKKGVIERVQTMITDNGGKVLKTDVWGSKQLAYEIQDFREGYYVYMEVAFDPKFGAELNQSLKYIEPIIRHSLIKTEE
jgi:small subunit ribosomal protein S6